MNTDFELCCWQRYWCCWQRVCGVCPLGEVSCRRMGAVVMIFEVSICWCSTAVTAVGCSARHEKTKTRLFFETKKQRFCLFVLFCR